MSWVTIIRGKDISKHAEGGAGSGILLTSATPLHASLVCGTSTMARTAGERHFRITSLERVSAFDRATRGTRHRLLRSPVPEQAGPGAAARADVEIRLDPVGLDSGRDQFVGLRLLDVGD